MALKSHRYDFPVDFPVLLAISDTIIKQSRSEKLSHKNLIRGERKGRGGEMVTEWSGRAR